MVINIFILASILLRHHLGRTTTQICCIHLSLLTNLNLMVSLHIIIGSNIGNKVLISCNVVPIMMENAHLQSSKNIFM
uniref:Uncharacterized protein n=1 Tax=Salix viminalis TaxID=40686 RepID=A0A6N2K9Q2_SALVM